MQQSSPFQLYGGWGSPYTRRVAITMKLHGIEFEHHPVTPFGEDKERLRTVNPLGRVPVLGIGDGEYLSESNLLIDYLESLAPADQTLLPRSGRARRDVLHYAGVAAGATDKLVTTLYEFHFRPSEKIHKPWIAMCDRQVTDGFRWLESQLHGDWLVGDQMTQADIAAAVFWWFGADKRRRFFERMDCPKLQGLTDRLSQLPAFVETEPVAGGGLPEGIQPE